VGELQLVMAGAAKKYFSLIFSSKEREKGAAPHPRTGDNAYFSV